MHQRGSITAPPLEEIQEVGEEDQPYSEYSTIQQKASASPMPPTRLQSLSSHDPKTEQIANWPQLTPVDCPF